MHRADKQVMTRIPLLGTPAIIVLLALAVPPCAWADDDLPPPPAPASAPADTAAPAGADTLSFEKRTIDAIQHISVRAIDSTQTEIRFDRWFWNAVGADAWVSWEVNDCGEQTGSPADSAREYPICVQAMAEWKDGRKAYLWIAVGSGNEVRGKPELAYASAGLGDNNQRTFHSLAQFAKYAQIEGKLEESVKK
ncbi:MAG: hypothetical protein E6K75_06945 [Candidatus Eisenbacteria bacterium]|uniref:Uncharacterized protein n=2 Tax=Eiseniibacteriota bacterium TaxID=2212470 RepID=A0A538T1F5_UNCEI|nr:MAG: hypothetical protein E6K75_06945 [Candidatus Eisenbacteria bacterium]